MVRAKQTIARPAPRKTTTKKEAGANAPASSVSKASGAEAQAELDVFIDRFAPEVAALGRKALEHMRKRLPGAVSLVYDNYNALAIGFGSAGRMKATPLSIAFYPRWVNLFFLQGAALPDPDGLMEGKGSTVRSIRITDARQLKDARIDALITSALLHNGWTLDPKAKNTLVIQSISPRQRPRRP